MRTLMDIIMITMLTAVLVVVVTGQRSQRMEFERVDAVRSAMRAIEAQALYRAAVGEIEATHRGYAREIHPDWFEHQPQNLLVEDPEALVAWIEHVDIEDPAERDRVHPPQIVADADNAPFWYNPHLGIVRARVPMQLSRRATIELYNRINYADLHPQQAVWPALHHPDAAPRNPSAASFVYLH